MISDYSNLMFHSKILEAIPAELSFLKKISSLSNKKSYAKKTHVSRYFWDKPWLVSLPKLILLSQSEFCKNKN